MESAVAIAKESSPTNGNVLYAFGVVKQGLVTESAVYRANRGIGKNLKTHGRIQTRFGSRESRGEVGKRLITNGRVGAGGGVALERLGTNSYVRADIDVPNRGAQGAAGGVVEKRSRTNCRIAAGGVE